MAYQVSFGKFDVAGNPAPVGLDFGPPKKPLSLTDALCHARQLVAEGKANISIEDGNGHSISDNDLIACYNGQNTLTPDLRAI
jgi:hypothetical protein